VWERREFAPCPATVARLLDRSALAGCKQTPVARGGERRWSIADASAR
jgi:hypothetical protein